MLISNGSIVDFKLFALAVKCPFPINLEVMKLFLYLLISSAESVMGHVWKPNCTAHRRLTRWVNRAITAIVEEFILEYFPARSAENPVALWSGWCGCVTGAALCGDSGVFFTSVLRRDIHKVILPWFGC